MAFPLWLTKLLVRTRLARFTPRGRRLANGGIDFLRYYSDRVLAAPVEEILDPAVIPDVPGPDVIDLNSPAPQIESSMTPGRLTADRWGGRAACGLSELREAIAAKLRRQDGRDLDPATEVIVTHGATGAYASVLDALVNPGDGVVLFDPCSPLFALGAKSRRANIRWVATRTEDGRLRLPEREFEKAMRGAKLLVLANPGNPAGTLADEDLEYVASIAGTCDVLAYVDETSARFRYDAGGKSLANMPGANQRVLTAGSITHEYALGALRVGWLTGPQHLVKACGLMANLHASFVPAPCQQASARVLSEPDATFEKTRSRLRARRDYAIERLRCMGLMPDRPSGGWFIWAPVAGLGMDGRAFAARLYRDQQVQVGPGCAYGPSGDGFIRLSFGIDDGRLRAGLGRMSEFVESLKEPVPAPPPSAPANANESEDPNEPVKTPADSPRPSFSRV